MSQLHPPSEAPLLSEIRDWHKRNIRTETNDNDGGCHVLEKPKYWCVSYSDISMFSSQMIIRRESDGTYWQYEWNHEQEGNSKVVQVYPKTVTQTFYVPSEEL